MKEEDKVEQIRTAFVLKVIDLNPTTESIVKALTEINQVMAKHIKFKELIASTREVMTGYSINESQLVDRLSKALKGAKQSNP